MILTVTLNPAIDKTYMVDNFRPGRRFICVQEDISAGGKGLNVSRALKCLGVKTMATGILGAEGAEIVKINLKKEKIKYDFFVMEGFTRINVTIVNKERGPMSRQILQKAKTFFGESQRTRILSPGQKIARPQIRSFFEKYERLLTKASCVVLSGRNANKAPDGLYRQMVRAATRLNIPVALDTHGRALSEGVKARPDIVAPNMEEAEAFVGFKMNTKRNIIKGIDVFHQKGIRYVLLSMDERGAVLSSPQGLFRAAAPRVKVRTTVGCGDALLAGFLRRYIKGQNIRQALRSAVAAGTANALCFSPGLVRREDFFRLRHDIKVEEGF